MEFRIPFAFNNFCLKHIFLISRYELQEKLLYYPKCSTPNKMIPEFLPEIALRLLEFIESCFLLFIDFLFNLLCYQPFFA